MSAVEVEIAKNAGPDEEPKGRKGEERSSSQSRTRQPPPPDADVEREVTKRELIRSVSNILIVILYMVFTLLRDRDAGVVVVDAEGGEADDWE